MTSIDDKRIEQPIRPNEPLPQPQQREDESLVVKSGASSVQGQGPVLAKPWLLDDDGYEEAVGESAGGLPSFPPVPEDVYVSADPDARGVAEVLDDLDDITSEDIRAYVELLDEADGDAAEGDHGARIAAVAFGSIEELLALYAGASHFEGTTGDETHVGRGQEPGTSPPLSKEDEEEWLQAVLDDASPIWSEGAEALAEEDTMVVRRDIAG